MEIIIVLIIVAVLVAIAVPSLVGYIEDAKQKAELGKARNTFSELNGVLLEADLNNEIYNSVVRWCGSTEPLKTIDYNGPTDNSVTLGTLTSHHDLVKHQIRLMSGGKVLNFGYRITLTYETGVGYRIKTMGIFYRNPSDAGIHSIKPDVTIGE